MDELVIVLVVVVVAAVMATPVAAVVALVRSNSLAAELASLRRQVAELNRRLGRLGDRQDATSASPSSATADPVGPDAIRKEGADAPHAPDPPRTRAVRAPHPGVPRPVTSRSVPDAEDEAAPRAEKLGGVGAGEAATAASDAESAEGPAPGAGGPRAEEPREEDGVGAGTAAGGSSPDSLDFETLIGTTWVLRIGLGILAIALALFARTVAPQLPPAAKVAVAYLGALALFGAGKFYEEKLEGFARPVMAAGLVFGFFVAFAAYFVPAMAAVPLPVSIAWMVIGMGTVLAAAERWRSQPTAALAIFLGHVSGFVATGQADTYSLSIIALLALTSAVLVLRHQWFELGVLAVVLTYGAHFIWIVKRGPVGGDPGFWLNLAFLTSYYVVFLIADVLWWRRHGEGDSARDGGGAVSPRYLGPANLVLYVSVTSFIYVATGAHLSSIEWYYLSLGTVQGVLAWFYRGAHHRDYVFYPAFGTILWTLGMFAALDALSLNLVLAGQALLLLFAAHRTRLWVFHALAQVALLVAFVHYWTFPTPAESTWPLFLGGLGLVAVYLVKASLEELWYGAGDDPDWFESKAAGASRGGTAERAFGRLFAPVAPMLASFHAALGGLVLVREGRAFFGWDPGLAVFIALAGLLVVGIVLVRRRTALLFTLSLAAAASVVLLARDAGAAPDLAVGGPVLSTSFILLFGLAVTGLGLGIGALRRLDDPASDEATWHGRAVIALILAGCLAAAAILPLSFAHDALWLLVPVVGLAFQELIAGRTGVGGQGAPGTPVTDDESLATPEALDLFLALAAALVLVRLMVAGVGMEPLAVVWVACGTVVLLAVAGFRGGGAFGVGGYTLMIAGYAFFLLSDGPLASTLLSTLWMGSVATLVPLGVAVVLDARTSDGEGDLPFHRSDATTLVAYALGLLLLGGLAYAQLPAGWAQFGPALFGLVLILLSRRLGLVRAVPAVLVALTLLHAFFLGRVARTEAVAGALWPIVMFGAVTLATERRAGHLAATKPGPAFARTMATVLVAATTLTVMAAIYTSALFGVAWATAGWSLLAGSLMGAGFALRSSLYRRTALLVLAACLIRVFLVDTRGLSSNAKTGAFFVLGMSLLGVGWLYSKYSERMKDWL